MSAGVAITVILLLTGEVIAWMASGTHYLRGLGAGEQLAAPKPADEQRVFVYGESTIYGYPYGAENSTARWLQVILGDVLPDRRVRVVNFGEAGRASEHLLDVVRHTLGYEPDVIVLCIGHNEFTGQSLTFTRLPWHRWIYARSFLYRRAHRLAERLQRYLVGPATSLPVPADTPLAGAVLQRYRQNLQAMVRLATQRAVRVVLVVPASNLLGFRPVLSVPRVPETDDARHQTEAAVATLRIAAAGHELNDEANQVVAVALASDQANADLHYWHGRWLARQGRDNDAYSALVRAKDLDGSRLRCLSEQAEILEDLSRRYGLPLVDLPAEFRSTVGGRPPGWELFISHCHPRPWGQYLMAVAIARALAERSWLAPSASWQWPQVPTVAEAIGRIRLSSEQWREPERQEVLEQLGSNPTLASELLEYPPPLAGPSDAEWSALRLLARMRLGEIEESRRVWSTLSKPDRDAMIHAASRWPSTVRQWWGDALAVWRGDAVEPPPRLQASGASP